MEHLKLLIKRKISEMVFLMLVIFVFFGYVVSESRAESVKQPVFAVGDSTAVPNDADGQVALAREFYANGDYVQVRKWLEKAANQGHADAQFNLGLLYAHGKGVRQDYIQARKWFEKAADQGDADAQFSLGLLYAHGKGVRQDYIQARKWFEKAADQGHADVQFSLGLLYIHGQEVEQDFVQARKWFEKAAHQGHADAQTHLGLLHVNGHGVKQDYIQAQKWFEKAADQGDADAQFYLGMLYYNGQGFEQDYVVLGVWHKDASPTDTDGQDGKGWLYPEGTNPAYLKAREWFEKAADQDHAEAQFVLGMLYYNGEGVTPDQEKACALWRLSAFQKFPDAIANHNLHCPD